MIEWSALYTKVDFPFQQVKSGSPDYVDRDIEEAMEDFMQRIECYRANYVSIDEEKDRYKVLESQSQNTNDVLQSSFSHFWLILFS